MGNHGSSLKDNLFMTWVEGGMDSVLFSWGLVDLHQMTLLNKVGKLFGFSTHATHDLLVYQPFKFPSKSVASGIMEPGSSPKVFPF